MSRTLCALCRKPFFEGVDPVRGRFCSARCGRDYDALHGFGFQLPKTEREASPPKVKASKLVAVPLDSRTIPDRAVFPWIRRCCVERAFQVVDKRRIMQRFEGFRMVKGMLAAVYRVEVICGD